MKVREALEELRRRNREIDRLVEREHALLDAATQITANYGGETVSHSRNMHSREDIIIARIEIRHELNRKIDAYADLKACVRQVLVTMDDRHAQEAIEEHYIKSNSIAVTAEKLNTSTASVKRWLIRGMEKIGDKDIDICSARYDLTDT